MNVIRLIGYADCNPVRYICSTLVIQTGEKSQTRQEWRKDAKRERLHAFPHGARFIACGMVEIHFFGIKKR